MLLEASTAIYEIWYDPSTEVLTLPEVVTWILPSTSSTAVAPSSTYTPLSSTVAGLSPRTVITGLI